MEDSRERGNDYDSVKIDYIMNHVHVHIVHPKAIVFIFVHGRCFDAVVQMWNLYRGCTLTHLHHQNGISVCARGPDVLPSSQRIHDPAHCLCF